MTYEYLRDEILSGISEKNFPEEWFVLDEKQIDDAVINRALKEHKCVYIPYIGFPIVLHNPIIMSSDMHLKVDEYQILMQGKESRACLLRNEHVQDGNAGPVTSERTDVNISVEGGIWNIRSRCRCKIDNTSSGFPGCLSSIVFSSVENLVIKNLKVFDSYVAGPAGDGAGSYGIQISNCKDFLIENIDLQNNRRDGVHINGPAEFGVVRHIRGKQLGDDLVSLLGWDWYNSGLSFGTIDHVWIYDVEGEKDEMRILPGQKVYADGSRVECDVRNCIIESVRNLYIVKIYEQHNIENPVLDFDDSSGTVGNVENLYFKDIFFRPNIHGFGGIPVNGLFDVCCNLTDCHFEDITVNATLDACAARDLSLIKVGPLSYIYGKYGDVFNPDSIGTIDKVSIKNAKFADEIITDKSKLISTVNKKQDGYGFISIGKGNGYGKVVSAEVIKT